MVYPNPSNGKVSLDFKNRIHSARVSVENASGVSVYNKILGNNFTGLLNIDLSSFASGLYFVKISSPENQYVYKLILDK